MQRPPPTTGLPGLPECWHLLTDSGVCERGADYFLRDKVQRLPARAGNETNGGLQHFQVQGSQRYQVQIDPSDPLQSSCDCPHAQEVPVCKHMVAAWMALQAAAAPQAAPALQPDPSAGEHIAAARAPRAARSTPSSKAASKLQDMQADLDFLQAQSAADLRAWIASQCDRNPQLALQLGLWRRQHAHQPQSAAQWRSFLTQAMPQQRGLYGRPLQHWAHTTMAALQPLEQQLITQPASIRTACTLALLRLYKLWESADDSHGQLHDLHAWLQDLLVRSVHAEAPPASWLKDWLTLMKANPAGHWDEPQMLSCAGPALRQAYSQHAIQAWEAWTQAHPDVPAQKARKTATRYGGFSYDDEQSWEQRHQRSVLRQRYLWAMEQQLDMRALILLMQQTAITPSDWMDTVEFCEQHAHPREALSSAQQGLQLDPTHEGLQAALLTCYQRDGWDEDAYALALQRLEQRPQDLGRLDTTLQCAMALGRTRAQALQVLLDQALARAQTLQDQRQHPTQDLSAPIGWLLREGLWQQALQLQQRPDVFCERKTLRALALKLPAAHHPQAVQLLQSLLALHMQDASTPYHAELQLVRLTLARMQAADAQAWHTALRQRYGRKINFIKGLDALQA